MDNNIINFYNNLVNLTRNKTLYQDFTQQDQFSDRMVIFLFYTRKNTSLESKVFRIHINLHQCKNWKRLIF